MELRHERGKASGTHHNSKESIVFIGSANLFVKAIKWRHLFNKLFSFRKVQPEKFRINVANKTYH